MLNGTHRFLLGGLLVIGTLTQAQVLPCPGYDPVNNVNLACEILTATRTGRNSSLGSLSPTIAAQLSQLPIATAVSGTGLSFSRELGVFTSSVESLGTILTQRGETLGRHKFLFSFNYQRFSFDSVDGIDLKDMAIISKADFTSMSTYTQADTRVDLRVDQFTALGTFGLTNRLDVSVIVPFAKVTLATGSLLHAYNVDSSNVPLSDYEVGTFYLPGSATGLGDVTVNAKANVFRGERSRIAIGGDVRFPTGDEANYLGTGAYGIKPYIVFSRRGRLTPNVNFGYQRNFKSALYTDNVTGEKLNLPSSLTYSAGVDLRVTKRLTLTSEFMGQYVLNGPRLAMGQINIPGAAHNPYPTVTTSADESYAMNNVGAGFKANPFKGLLLNATVMFKLDDGGLRSNFVPLAGMSYRF